MQCWGSEFITEREPEPPLQKHPWKRYEDAIALPMWIVDDIVDPNEVSRVLNERPSKLPELQHSIMFEGLLEPAMVHISATKLRYQNGYHRYLVCKQLDWNYMPVRFTETDVSARGMNLVKFVQMILRTENGD